MGNSNRALRKSSLCLALSLGLSLLASTAAYAGNTDGSVVGRTTAGAVVTVTSPDTGFTRSVTADSNGNYRFPYLPIGQYKIEASQDGKALGTPEEVTVTLGNATTANLGSTEQSLDVIQVNGTATSVVDVTSTEVATNITREDLALLPVDQTLASVAILTPGVNSGVASFGGISFGGSSVAENSYYVNGLNVTDFYNRNGFSTAPFAFYQEFQVKTGGYSVEFGRSTGGVVNAVTRSGTNEFHYGAQLTTEPSQLQSSSKDRFDAEGIRYISSSKDEDSLTKLNLFASGALVKDKLFFFLMYEGRDNTPRNTNNDGTAYTYNKSNDGFWGAKLDWHINDKNLLEFTGFSDANGNVGSVYNYDFEAGQRGDKTNEIYNDTGGKNWALTWSSYLTNDLSMKVMYGENNRESFTRSLSDLECNRVAAVNSIPSPGVPLGCTTSSKVEARDDNREAARVDFDWSLGDHLLRFGLDHEKNTSVYDRHYPGPGGFYYNIYSATAGATIPNGGILPDGYEGYVRARRYEIAGTFQSSLAAAYIEDNWSVTPNFLLNLGLRTDSFDNKDSSGASYIKLTNMIAPRLGFSWDLNGDGSMKLFGNLGRYFLPVANVINIKQAGGLLDERTYYAFDGYQLIDRNGSQYAAPILGPQIGDIDNSQGDGTVGDLRSEVDRNMDPVYQDELILGFQQRLNESWSWGVSGTYRKLNNAIDDMEITATAACGADGYVGYVMANPGKPVTVWGDTDCDGEADGWVTVDTSREGWALYDSEGNYLGQRGWVTPKRTYKALEFQIDHPWDGRWALNASYTLSKSEGNAEGPVNSDTEFDDTGRTENFDDPWVNYGGDGYLPNDRRHQFKVRGAYALNDHWRVGGDLDLHSGTPVTGFGVGNPFDGTNYHSYYICVQNCEAESPDRVYESSPRGKYGRTPWTYNIGASVSWVTPISDKGDLQVKFAVYNLLNQQRTTAVDQDLQTDISSSLSETFRQPIRFQNPRFAQLTVTASF